MDRKLQKSSVKVSLKRFPQQNDSLMNSMQVYHRPTGAVVSYHLMKFCPPLLNWKCPPNQVSNEIPFTTENDIVEAFLLQKLCDEELLLLQNEMHNVIDYYNQKEKKIATALHKIINGESSHFSRGCICLLKKL